LPTLKLGFSDCLLMVDYGPAAFGRSSGESGHPFIGGSGSYRSVQAIPQPALESLLRPRPANRMQSSSSSAAGPHKVLSLPP